MSAKGRSSIVLLGCVATALLLAPLVYLAAAAWIDNEALNARIAALEATEIANPTALQADYRGVVESFLPILPPDSDFRCGTSQGLVVFDPANFKDWEALEPEELNGVAVYPVTVADDPETRYTVFYNALGEPIATLAPEQDYNPFSWLETIHPEYYSINANPDDLVWAEAQYDPARMSVTYYLLAIEDVPAMAEAQLAATEQRELEMSMMMGEELPEPVTNLVIFAIEPTTNGMALGIGWPDDFTNKVEVFARATIAPTGWFVASTNISTSGTNSLWWLDAGLSNALTRFYRVGNADLDSDADGLTDARERLIYGTDESSIDSDNDGLVDGYSGQVTTNDYPVGAHTNEGVYVEGELTWGTDLLLADTDDDGMGDGWEVTNGHDPLDPNDPPNVSGEIMYQGGQIGSFWVVAVTTSNSWATNYCDVSSDGSYRITNLPATNYWLKGWLDANENEACDHPEATGFFTNNPVLVTNKVGGIDIFLTDPDLDSDNLPDWWEIACFDSITNWNGSSDPDEDSYTNLEEYEAGTSPVDDLDHPWNIGGTISYNGPQTGTIYVVACTSATEWAAARFVTLATPEAYVITHLPPDRNYWIRAWRDSYGDEAPAFWEAWGEFHDNPITLNTNVAGVDLPLQDADSDTDGLPDWWEVLYGFDPQNGGGEDASAWWKLNATEGTNVQDSTSHTNHGVLFNASATPWTGGVISNALSFDGIDDYVQIPDSDSLKPNFVSVSLWVNPSRDYTDEPAVFFSKKQGSTGYRLSYEQGALTFLVCASGEKTISHPINLVSGVWHHVVGSYGGSSQMLYVDGELVGETNYNWGFGFGYIDHDTTPPRIGSTSGTASNFFSGLIDDVQVYARELTSNQVWGIYEPGLDEDGDGLSVWQEYQIGLSPTNADTDADGLLDGEEIFYYQTNPTNADTDSDGLLDGDELFVYSTDPLNPDTDGDELSDGDEVEWNISYPYMFDSDSDGLSDYEERFIYFTHPLLWDSDGDFLSDPWEIAHSLDPKDADTDNDGLPDGHELMIFFTDPLDPDTDDDGLKDLEDWYDYGADPLDPDTDDDGLLDGDEVFIHLTSPILFDSDGDDLSDGDEVNGCAVWSVTTTNSISWVNPGTNAHWITQWATGIVNNGFIKGGISQPVNAPIQLGSQIHQNIRISSDGVILLDPNDSSDALSYGVNLPMTWPALSNLVAVCWDEYSISATAGVWYEVSGSGATARVTVTWSGAKVAGFTSSAEGLDFQMEFTASNRAFTLRYKTSSGLQFPEQALFSIGLRGASTNRLCRIVFNRLNVLEPDTTITIAPAISCPTNTDTDADGYIDGYEADRGWNPTAQEDWGSDVDGDGVDFYSEVYYYQTDPFEVDTDGDGLDDKYEIDMGTDPIKPYFNYWDGDYLSLEEEYCYGTSPWTADTDDDQVDDYTEIVQGSDPCDAADGGGAPPEGSYEFRPRLFTDAPLGLGGTLFIVGNYRLTPSMFWDGGYASLRLDKGREYEFEVVSREGYIQCASVNTGIQCSEGNFVQVIGEDCLVCKELIIENASVAFGALGTVPTEENDNALMKMDEQIDTLSPTSPKSKIQSRKITITNLNGSPVQRDVCPSTLFQLKGNVTPSVAGSYNWSSTPNVSISTTTPGPWPNQNAQFTINTSLVVTCKFIDYTWVNNDFHTNVSITMHAHDASFSEPTNQSYGYDVNSCWMSIETSKTTTICANVSPEGCSGPYYITSSDPSKVSAPTNQISNSQEITLTAGSEESTNVIIELHRNSPTGPVLETIHVAVFKKRIIHVFIHKTNGAANIPSISQANDILKQAVVEVISDGEHSCPVDHAYVTNGPTQNLDTNSVYNEQDLLLRDCDVYNATNSDYQNVYILVHPKTIGEDVSTTGLHRILGNEDWTVLTESGCVSYNTFAHELFHTFGNHLNEEGNLMHESGYGTQLKPEQWFLAH